MKLLIAIVNNDDAHIVNSSPQQSRLPGNKNSLDRRIFNERQLDFPHRRQ